MKHFKQLLVSLALSFFTSQMAGQVIYLAPNGTGAGTSWADAAGDLRAVLDAAQAGAQIWVKAGTYRPTTCTNCVVSDRILYFQVKNGLKLYGGFAGFETSLTQRNITNNPTILSGDIDADGTPANNSFTVIFTQNASPLTVIDGFIITGGNADAAGAGLGTPQSSGGGWFNLGAGSGNNSSPTINNCTFLGNQAYGYGGGMYNDGSFGGTANPTLNYCTFSNNNARDSGGGIHNAGNFGGFCNPVFNNCQFVENKSQLGDGGAMFNKGQSGTCSPTLTNCTFVRDTAYHEGGGVCSFSKDGSSNPVMTNCTFQENVAVFGGAVYNDGSFNGVCEPVFTGCYFSANHSENDGAAMYNSGYQGHCSPTLVQCVFENNHSAFAGGAVFNHGSSGFCGPVVRNCSFIANVADTYGGAMYNLGKGVLGTPTSGSCSPDITNCLFVNNVANSAGAVYNLGAENGNANAVITNCTFYGNTANVGADVYCNAGDGGTGTASPTVRNCIFWNNEANFGKVFRIIWGTPTISNCLADVPDCDGLYNGMGGSVTCLGGMIFNQDPLFEDTAANNFHLTTGSPAIDIGNNSAIIQTGVGVDLDSLPRIYNSTVDLGVYEFGSTLGSAPIVAQNPVSQTVCLGSPVQFSVSANGQQPIDFQWFKDGLPLVGETSEALVIPATTLFSAGIYTCQVSNSFGNAVSLPAVLVVEQPATVGLSISASGTQICEGEPVTFTATPLNAGPAPIFQWFLNGNAFGASIQSFTSVDVQDGDTFTCQVTSLESCVQNSVVSSNSWTISVESTLTASLEVAVDAVPICEGNSATLTATPVNGGNSPSFLWTLNGVAVGADAPTLVVANPQDGDLVQCQMTSSKTCLLQNPVSSNTFELEVLPTLAAGVSIVPSVDSTICLGTELTFTATTWNGGALPNFEWRVNGTQAASGANPDFSTASLLDGDVVLCYLTSSEACLLENPVSSNALQVSVDSCAMGLEYQHGSQWRFGVYPNPSTGKIKLDFYEVTNNFVFQILNPQGQIVFKTLENHSIIPLTELDLSSLPKGIYYLQIISESHRSVQKLVLH